MLIVFDFDGTLMDTLRDLAEAASDLSEAYGGGRLSEAATAAMVGDGAPILVERILAAAGVLPPPPEALERYLAFYDRRVLDHTAPYPGVPEMLEGLVPRHRLALLTNKPEASTRILLAHTRLDTYFPDGVFGDGALPRKPDPAGLQWLMTQAGTEPGETLMVGDSIMDLEAARRSGARAAIARYGFGFAKIPANAIRPDDVVLDHPGDLLGYVDGR